MKKLNLVLALCAVLVAPAAFANDHGAAAPAADTTAAAPAAPAAHGKKMKKKKAGKMHSEKAKSEGEAAPAAHQ